MESRSINLGRCHNKYLIIDILVYSSEDPEQESQSLLWVSSRRHREFLASNISWYPSIMFLSSLLNKSKELETLKQAKFMFDHVRLEGDRKVTKVTRIFRASEDGWHASAFHKHCDAKGPTLSLVRSDQNYLAGGFNPESWRMPWRPEEAKSGTLFALTNEL